MKAKIFYGPRSRKTRTALERRDEIGKENTVFLSSRNTDFFNNDHFKYHCVTEKTKLLIIDDCQPNFDFLSILSMMQHNSKGELVLKVEACRMSKPPITVFIPEVIFTTEHKPNLRTGMSLIAASIAQWAELIKFTPPTPQQVKGIHYPND